MYSVVLKHVPLRVIFRVGNFQKALEARPEDSVLCLGDDSRGILHNRRCVAWCITVMQKPLSLPLVPPLPLNSVAQSLQNLHVEMTSNTLARRYEPTVLQIVGVKGFRELFDYPAYDLVFLLG
jgi:hypothetical protein